MIDNFSRWKLNEAVTPVDDTATVFIGTLGTWTKVGCKLVKERGKVSTGYDGRVMSSKWFKDRKKIFENLEKTSHLIADMLGMTFEADMNKWEYETIKGDKGIKYTSGNQHVTQQERDKLDADGKITERLSKAYQKVTNIKWHKGMWENGLHFKFTGQIKDLESLTEKFYTEIEKEFRTEVISKKYGL